jgi:hypothetical protein
MCVTLDWLFNPTDLARKALGKDAKIAYAYLGVMGILDALKERTNGSD